MKVTYKEREVILPDFLFIGASRSGTTSLYTYLVNHPEIFMPSMKEPQFFSYLGENFSPHHTDMRKDPWNVEDYLELFVSARPDQVIGEASTSYLYIYPRTIENIKAIYGEQMEKIKIIAVLRNPVDRAWSQYMLKWQAGDWKKDFLTVSKEFAETREPYVYYNYIASGMFYNQVKTFQETFPHTKFYLFEELKSEPERVVKECLEFIGVKNTTLPENVGKVFNFAGVPKNKLVAPLYRFLFGRNKFKIMIKHLFPEKMRYYTKRAIGLKIMKKPTMPEDGRQYLLLKYRDDITKLADLFQDEKQKRIITGWLG